MVCDGVWVWVCDGVWVWVCDGGCMGVCEGEGVRVSVRVCAWGDVMFLQYNMSS